MCDLTGESVARLERMGVKVRSVERLGEAGIYFRKRALVLLDDALSPVDLDAILAELMAELVLDLEWSETVRQDLT